MARLRSASAQHSMDCGEDVLAGLPQSLSPTAELSNPGKRSFGGCATCRGRHVKCDETRPTCTICAYFGFTCAGYEKSIFFDSEDVNAESGRDGVTRFRRPLFTEKERQCMSQSLVADIPSKSVLRALQELDEQCDTSSAYQNLSVTRGPFGVFRTSPANAAPSPSSLNDLTLGDFQDNADYESFEGCSSDNSFGPLLGSLEDVDSSQGIVTFFHELPAPLEAHPASTSTAQALAQASVDHLEHTFMYPFSFPHQWNTSIGTAFEDVSASATLSFPDLWLSASPRCPASARDSVLSLPLSENFTSIPPIVSSSNQHSITDDAVLLLQHYAKTIVTLLTPVRHSKTPWHVLFIPHVKQCLAAVMLGEKLDHACLTAFYGILAISAFSLGGTTQSQMWLAKAEGYKQQSREHVRTMLKTAYTFPKTASYKSTLMALLAMVQLSNFAGTRDQTDCYFLEAEKLIRIRGLSDKRKKSRKVRLLHHCYVFERIFHESTFLAQANTVQRLHLRKSVESSGELAHSRDGLSFRLPLWRDFEQEMSEVKNQYDGENDLHLSRLGAYPPTLYPEIFGVPEIFIHMLSLVVRLGNEKDSCEDEEDSNCLNLKAFMSRAKAIERYINRMPRLVQSATSNLASSADRDVLANLADAARQAIAIYFYRRIYDVDASILQEKVVGVRDCLLRCSYADPSAIHGSALVVWPAFVAACEAEDILLQASFFNIFETLHRRTGLLTFTETMSTVEQIWHEKRLHGGTSITWLDLVKQGRKSGSQNG